MVCSSESRARVQAYHGPLGQRLVVQGRIGTLLRYTQTLTLWRGVARVDCRTTIDEFTGEDRLVRLRWPCPVPGAMPVSEVGDAVVGRGFALLHQAGESPNRWTPREHLWTLDNPAYCWFGLSSAARVRVDDSSASGVGGRGGVSGGGDVWSAGARPDGRAGPRRRHRHLQRRRQAALRPPRRRLQPAGCADRAGWSGTQRLHQGSAGRGRPGVRRTNSTGSWPRPAGPGCGCRQRRRWRRSGCPAPTCVPLRALPVLVIDGSDEKNLERRDRVGDRRPRRRRDRRHPAGPAGNGTIRCPHRRAAQPRRPELRRRVRRHPAHRADALLHRLAVRYLDRRTTPHRARRLELPTPALDTRFRLRAGLRRRRLAARRDPNPQCAVLPSTARCPSAPAGGPAGAGRLAAARRPRRTGAPGRPQGGRQPAGGRQHPAGRPRRGGPAAGGNDRSRTPASPSAPSWAR